MSGFRNTPSYPTTYIPGKWGFEVHLTPTQPRPPWEKPWAPTPPSQRQIDIAQEIATRRSQEQAQRQAEQARSRERYEREAREREVRERQREEKQRRLRQQLQHERDQQQRQREHQEPLRREKERMQQLRETETRLRAQRTTFSGAALGGILKRPQAEYIPLLPSPVYITNNYGQTACIAHCGNPPIRMGYTPELEVFERIFGPRLESAKKQDQFRQIIGLIFPTLLGYGVARAPRTAMDLILRAGVAPTAVRGLTYQQGLAQVGNEYHLLIDMVQRTGQGGMGVLEFPKQFQSLANILGKPVRAGFHANVQRGLAMEKLITRMGHTTREGLSVGGQTSAAYTRMYYPTPK